MVFEKKRLSTIRLALGATALTLIGSVASADQVIIDDLIVDGSACIGQDCVNGENFGFDTIRIKENNLRIRAFDTSSTASFPSNDWQLTFNDSSNGGANKFSIDDIDGGRTPFTIEAGAPSHSLYVEDSGRIGFGLSTPVVELHVRDGDTPTLRLEQDGSSGFGAQTWDVAGNETNFFVRDATNGSRLPFRIRPSAPSQSLFIDTDGDIGLGTSSPTAALHVRRTNGEAQILVDEGNGSAATRTLLMLSNNGSPALSLLNTANSAEWRVQQNAGNMQITLVGSGNTELGLDGAGNMTLSGTLTTGSATVYPDYVFAPDYPLMPLSEVAAFIADNGHLPKIPTAEEVAVTGLNISEMQVALLEKVEELTLYTLEQQKTIDALQQRLDGLAD